jgi:hypothetical protein
VSVAEGAGRLRRARELGADLARGALFFGCAGLHTRWRVRPDEAGQIVRGRLQRRERDFLELVRSAVFGHARSPYLRILRHAGCEYGDLERLVGSDGLEGALENIYRRGVYLSVEELKGKRPVQRGSLSFPLRFRELRSPHWLVPAEDSGRRAGRTGPMPIYQAMLQSQSIDLSLQLATRGGFRWQHGLWDFPVFSRLHRILRHTGVGCRSLRLFGQAPPGAALSVQEVGIAHLTDLLSRALGLADVVRKPVPFEDPRPIIDWMRATLRAGLIPHLTTVTSAATSLCEVAAEAGVEVAGTQLTVYGDPLTAGRLAPIQRVGATVVPTYGTTESGGIATGCLSPARPDDMHLHDDLHAAIQPGPDGESQGLPENTLLLTSLRQSWPFVLVNVSMGDHASLEARGCGCPLQRVGWRRHIHTVRSFEKLRIGGYTMLVASITEILDARLPARFGGGPTDYQLVEREETVDGTPGLRLLVDPGIGPLDERLLAETLLECLREAGVPIHRMWQTVRWLGVERRPPLRTDSGKIYHVQQESWAGVRG